MLLQALISFFKHPFFVPRMFFWGLSLLAISPLLLLTKTYFSLKKQFPQIIENFDFNPSLPIQVFSSDGKLLCNIYKEGRTTQITYKDLPPALVKTVVAVNDSLFFEHDGVIVSDIWNTHFYHYTLDMHLSYYLNRNIRDKFPTRLLKNKFLLPWMLEHYFTKEEILLACLNQMCYYEGAYGIEKTSENLFHTKTHDLNLQQIALIVAATKSYYLHHLYEEQEEALRKRNQILALMARKNIYPPEWKDSLQQIPLGLVPLDSTKKRSNENGYIKDYVTLYLKDWQEKHPEKDIYSEGLTIYTGIDSRLQDEAEKVLKSHLAEIQPIFDKEKDEKMIDEVTLNRYACRSAYYRDRFMSGQKKEEILASMDEKLNTKIYTSQGEKDTLMSEKEKIRYHLGFLQAGMCAIDPYTGYIKVYIGGINHKYFPNNKVSLAKRQVGAAIKPLRFVNQLEAGIEPCEIGKFLEYAMGALPNPYPHSPKDQEIVECFSRMGITSEMELRPSTKLGVFEVSVSELAGSYTPFVNNGMYASPQLITRIESQKGDWHEDMLPVTWQATTPHIANAILKMLHEVVTADYGTGRSLSSKYKIKTEIGGKNGNIADNADFWFTGLTTNLVTTIWVGSEERKLHFKSMDHGQAAKIVMPIFGKWIQDLEKKGMIQPSLFGDKRIVNDCPKLSVKHNKQETESWDKLKRSFYKRHNTQR